MSTHLPCSNCGQMIGIREASCPFCDFIRVDGPNNAWRSFSISHEPGADPTCTGVGYLYQAIHQQISALMGDINFSIALYDSGTDQVEIPYAGGEDNATNNILPFPLGEDLISMVIKTSQPLLLGEDTMNRTAELGAKTLGASTKSWLGVPLIVAGEVIGVLILQDFDEQHRFDIDDQQMLSSLSTQVAISIRNAHLLQETQKRAERERIVAELTNKLWASTNVETILRTALKELGQTMNASQGYIQLDISEQS